MYDIIGVNTIEVPGWVLSNVGAFVGFVILSAILLKGQKYRREIRKKQEQESYDEQTRQLMKRVEREQQSNHEQQRASLLEAERLARLLPGPWRTLYDFLLGYPNMTREAVILSLVTFKSDVPNIPTICPGGFDLVLGVTYYTLGAEGNCIKECVNLLEDYVKFPLDSENA